MTTSGTIFDIRRFCIHDGPGIRTTVFFQGCPLDCWWCHNPEGRSLAVSTVSASGGDAAPRDPGIQCDVESVMAEVMKDLPFYEESGGGVTFSGGEPMAQIDYLEALLTGARERALHCTVDTCGYCPREHFYRIRNLVDLFLYDLKLIDPGRHVEYTGVSNELILKNLQELIRLGARVRIRVPLVPEITDTEENLNGLLTVLKSVGSVEGISLLPYNRLAEDKARRFGIAARLAGLKPQSDEQLDRIASRFRSNGFEVRIGG